MPLPNTRLIHRDWERHHYRTASGRFTAECTITDLDFQVIQEDCPCNVQRRGEGNMTGVVANQQITQGAYMWSIPAQISGIRANFLVTITKCTGDPDLIGQQLIVRAPIRGSLTWQRDFACDLYGQPDQPGAV